MKKLIAFLALGLILLSCHLNKSTNIINVKVDTTHSILAIDTTPIHPVDTTLVFQKKNK